MMAVVAAVYVGGRRRAVARAMMASVWCCSGELGVFCPAREVQGRRMRRGEARRGSGWSGWSGRWAGR